MNKGILLILDGYGYAPASKGNAVENANTPTLHSLKALPHSLLSAHGEAVGLFAKEMGGSEVGHMTIGAGRIVPSTAKLINDEIQSGIFKSNKVLNAALTKLENSGGDLHLCGLMSDKNIHSNINHCIEIVKYAQSKVKNIYIHFITDGRDSGIYESLNYLKLLKTKLKGIKNCEILSVAGRAFAMDRDNNSNFTNKAFNSMFFKINEITNIEDYIKYQHSLGKNDQYIEPAYIRSKTYVKISKNDCILFFNFREDRMRQISKKCEELKCMLVTMSDVGGTNSKVMYPSKIVKNTLSEYLSKNNIKHVKISESTKYAHVTYFFNGGREEPFECEDRIHVPTTKVDDFIKTPNMQAKEITNQVEQAINKKYDAIIVNYSNADMIGHTGDYDVTVKSLEFVDKCVKKVLQLAKKNNYFVLVTADHGNADEMLYKNGEPNAAHSINPVLCVVADGKHKMKATGGLQDVAPTLLDLMNVKPNKYFEGKSLILR